MKTSAFACLTVKEFKREEVKMDMGTIYSVAWWEGTSLRITTFTKRENANTFSKRLVERGDFFESGVYEASDKDYLKLSRNCVDYEPPKKI